MQNKIDKIERKEAQRKVREAHAVNDFLREQYDAQTDDSIKSVIARLRIVAQDRLMRAKAAKAKLRNNDEPV